jgi:hypothetical protein
MHPITITAKIIVWRVAIKLKKNISIINRSKLCADHEKNGKIID